MVPIGIIILLVNMVVSGTKVGAGSDTLTPEAVTKRIAPVAGFELVDANAPKVFKTGEQVFAAVCTACHTAGVAGAPKIGDNAAWAPFIKAGYESLLNVALHGKGGMRQSHATTKSGASLPEPRKARRRKKPLLRPLLLRPRRAGSCRCRPGRRGSRSRSARPAAAAPRRNRPPSTRPAKAL